MFCTSRGMLINVGTRWAFDSPLCVRKVHVVRPSWSLHPAGFITFKSSKSLDIIPPPLSVFMELTVNFATFARSGQLLIYKRAPLH